MRILVLICLAIFAAYTGWERLRPPARLEPLHETPYIIVYGRDTCPYTSAMRKTLARAEVPFHYEIIDDEPARSQIHERMRAVKIDTSYYELPVVDVSAKILVHPEPASVLEAFRASR